MSVLDQVILLGDPRLHQSCDPLEKEEVEASISKIELMSEIVLAFQEKYAAGRAIAAPQIGWMKRVVVYNVEKKTVMINPVLNNLSKEMIEIWDDCMSFPDLLVKIKRHKYCTIQYLDLDWNLQSIDLKDDLSELFQHECDHLDGRLAIDRAIDSKSFKWIKRPLDNFI